MTPFEAGLLALVAGVVVVALVALRFPSGRREWPLDARQTVWLLLSAFTAVLVFVLLYIATREVRWPSIMVTTFAGVSLGLALLLVAALFLPQGLRARP